MPANKTPSIPEGYTFLNTKTFISEKAKKIVIDMLKKADDRNPDVHDMYIYNDYYNYAILDIIDHTLSSINGKIKKKEWDEAFAYLEALVIFQDMESMWPMADDGDRIVITNKVFGACLITTLRALTDEGRLDATHFPSLETMLSRAASWGDAMTGMNAGSDYHIVCKGIGKRLFSNKTEQEKALEKKRVQEWISTLDKEDQDEMMDDDDDEDEDEDDEEEKKPWYEGSADEHLDDDDFKLWRTWKEYKEYLAECPTKPLRGPPKWDLTKWTQAEKAPFLFDNQGDDDDDDELMFL